MYEDYYRFSQKPFQNDLNPDFLYFSEKHEEALVRMLYAVSEHKGLMVLTGDWGTGKTLLSRIFLTEISRRRYRGALVSPVEDNPASILRQWLSALGQEAPRGDLLGLLTALKEFAAANSAEGRETLLMLDDAEHIRRPETFEFLKNLLAMDRGGQRLFTLFLVGQKVLLGRVEEHPGLLTSVELTYILRAFSPEETENYIAHRVRLVGGEPAIFSSDALRLIHQLAGGCPRLINSLADLALFTAAGKGADKVDTNIIMAAKTEILQLKGA